MMCRPWCATYSGIDSSCPTKRMPAARRPTKSSTRSRRKWRSPEVAIRFSLSALGRAKGVQRVPVAGKASQQGAYVSIEDLSALEVAARDFTFLPRQPVQSILAGRHGSRVRGRGLAFEELRPYLPG